MWPTRTSSRARAARARRRWPGCSPKVSTATGGPLPSRATTCPSCVAITEGSSLDVMEIDGASNRGIDEIRELRERIRYAPARARYKVYIIDEVHMLTNEAFNALLKMLEEPPSHVVFIFATTDPQRVLPTILSRCQRFDFRRLSVEELAGHLAAVAKGEGVPADPAALQLIARHADGGARDALSMLEQCIAYRPEGLDVQTVADVLGLVGPEALADLAAAYVEGRASDALAILDRLVSEKGLDSRLVARDLLAYLREVATARMMGGGGERAGSPAFPRVGDLAKAVAVERLVAAMDALLAAEPQMRWAPDPRIALELAVMRLAAPSERPAASPPAAGPVSPPAAVPVARGRAASSPRPKEPVERQAPDEGARKAESHRSSRAAAHRERPALVIDEVQRRWNEVLAALRNQQRPAAARVGALLREGRPVRVDGDEITVGFPPGRAFHRNAVEGDARAREAVEKVLGRLFGRPVTLRTEILDGVAEEEPAGEPPAGESAEAAPVQAAPRVPAGQATALSGAPAPQSQGASPRPAAVPFSAVPPPPPLAPPPPPPPGPPASGAGPPGEAEGDEAPVPKPSGASPGRSRSAASRERRAPGKPHQAAGASEPFDEATLAAVLQILGARIIKEFEEPPGEAAAAAGADEGGEQAAGHGRPHPSGEARQEGA
ncbi:MAG: DNA polymerase III subunit gamma/tau [Limnochordaceae bacterium]|nr:DNA polymerase III subunit gamma/tau [Limnochordaceae bacterium]